MDDWTTEVANLVGSCAIAAVLYASGVPGTYVELWSASYAATQPVSMMSRETNVIKLIMKANATLPFTVTPTLPHGIFNATEIPLPPPAAPSDSLYIRWFLNATEVQQALLRRQQADQAKLIAEEATTIWESLKYAPSPGPSITAATKSALWPQAPALSVISVLIAAVLLIATVFIVIYVRLSPHLKEPVRRVPAAQAEIDPGAPPALLLPTVDDVFDEANIPLPADSADFSYFEVDPLDNDIPDGPAASPEPLDASDSFDDVPEDEVAVDEQKIATSDDLNIDPAQINSQHLTDAPGASPASQTVALDPVTELAFEPVALNADDASLPAIDTNDVVQIEHTPDDILAASFIASLLPFADELTIDHGLDLTSSLPPAANDLQGAVPAAQDAGAVPANPPSDIINDAETSSQADTEIDEPFPFAQEETLDAPEPSEPRDNVPVEDEESDDIAASDSPDNSVSEPEDNVPSPLTEDMTTTTDGEDEIADTSLEDLTHWYKAQGIQSTARTATLAQYANRAHAMVQGLPSTFTTPHTSVEQQNADLRQMLRNVQQCPKQNEAIAASTPSHVTPSPPSLMSILFPSNGTDVGAEPEPPLVSEDEPAAPVDDVAEDTAAPMDEARAEQHPESAIEEQDAAPTLMNEPLLPQVEDVVEPCEVAPGLSAQGSPVAEDVSLPSIAPSTNESLGAISSSTPGCSRMRAAAMSARDFVPRAMQNGPDAQDLAEKDRRDRAGWFPPSNATSGSTQTTSYPRRMDKNQTGPRMRSNCDQLPAQGSDVIAQVVPPMGFQLARNTAAPVPSLAGPLQAAHHSSSRQPPFLRTAPPHPGMHRSQRGVPSLNAQRSMPNRMQPPSWMQHAMHGQAVLPYPPHPGLQPLQPPPEMLGRAPQVQSMHGPPPYPMYPGAPHPQWSQAQQQNFQRPPGPPVPAPHPQALSYGPQQPIVAPAPGPHVHVPQPPGYFVQSQSRFVQPPPPPPNHMPPPPNCMPPPSCMPPLNYVQPPPNSAQWQPHFAPQPPAQIPHHQPIAPYYPGPPIHPHYAPQPPLAPGGPVAVLPVPVEEQHHSGPIAVPPPPVHHEQPTPAAALAVVEAEHTGPAVVEAEPAAQEEHASQPAAQMEGNLVWGQQPPYGFLQG